MNSPEPLERGDIVRVGTGHVQPVWSLNSVFNSAAPIYDLQPDEISIVLGFASRTINNPAMITTEIVILLLPNGTIGKTYRERFIKA